MFRLLTTLFIFTLLTSLFTIASAAPSPAPIPQTGQTTCYDSPGAIIDCAGTGQDGELKTGVAWPSPRFTANADSTVTDNLTGLIWSKDANPASGTKTWQGALDYVKSLNSGNYLGHNDWRLPNSNELESLLNKGQASPATWLNTQGFSNVMAYAYWSSSTYYTFSAWLVHMASGYVFYYGKTSYDYYVWPVRGGQLPLGSLMLPKTGQTACYDSVAAISCAGTGQDGELQTGVAWPTPRFSVNANQTVTDNLTGLNWGKDANPAAGPKTWQEAVDYIKSLNSSNYQGHNDWRLPNSNELESLVNKGGAPPTNWLSTQGFSNVQEYSYWSSTTYAYSTYNNWLVYVVGGHAGIYSKADGYYVWPVRGGQLPPGSLTLTTAKTGVGSGTIASSPAGISCGATCSASFTSGTTVILTATPASGSIFSGWSGACSGTGACSVTMDAVKSVGAIFNITGPAENGVCGTSHNQSFSIAPAANLCATGLASVVSGSGPWNWSCIGVNGGTSISCATAIGLTLVTDASWKTATTEQSGWTTEAFVDSSWGNAYIQHDYFNDSDYGHLSIWGAPEGTPLPVSYFRKTFSLQAIPLSAKFTIAVDDDYELYVNGTQVGVDLSNNAGPRTTYDVASLLHAGINVIAIKGIDIGGNHFLDGWLVLTSPSIIKVDGTCGTANGTIITIAPTSNLCIAGTPSTVTGSGPWNWSCSGSGGGANATCSASKLSNSSLTWRHRGDGTIYGMTTDGNAITGGAQFWQESNPAWSIVGQGDFDGDGIKDFVWQNSTTGQVYIMLMSGPTTVKSGAAIYTESNTNWKIVATGDINGDGTTDLIWWNNSTGQVYVMLINGITITGGNIIYTEANTNWKIVAAADFNGNGKAELLWWNSTTGQVAIGQTNGTSTSTAAVIYTEPNTVWRIAGAGDLDGDGKAEIVWHNRTTGQVYGMQTNGSSVTNGAMMYTEPDTNWEIVSVGNYNSDNKAELLWWNQQTGQLYLMPMNGLSVAASGTLLYTEPDTTWHIQGETEWRDNLYGRGVTTTTK
ncbi:MAG: DUF1566 domain-containing protein [Desulfuromonadales bacterium]